MTVKTGRLITMLACGSAALALSACGGGSEESAEAPSETAAAPTPAEAEVETADAEDAVEEAVDEVEVAMTDAADTMDDAAGAMESAMDDAADKVENVVDAAADEAEGMVDATVAAVQDAADSGYAALTGDAAAGRRVFAKCMACHAVQEGQNRVGPSLYGIVGRTAGTVPGFNYSDANANSGVTWTEEVLFTYLEDPQSFMPGTRMIFPGLPSEQERVDVIAYLKETSQ